MSRLVEGVLAADAHPPRSVPLVRVVIAAVRTVLGLSAAIFGLGGALLGLAFVIASDPIVRGFGLLFIAGGLFFLGAPVVYAVRVHNALRVGVATTAEVMSVDARRDFDHATLDGMRSGSAAGTWRVRHPLGDFDAPFRYEGRGAARLRPGARVRVLTAPDARRVLLELETLD